jgi:hypothetical protein
MQQQYLLEVVLLAWAVQAVSKVAVLLLLSWMVAALFGACCMCVGLQLAPHGPSGHQACVVVCVDREC